LTKLTAEEAAEFFNQRRETSAVSGFTAAGAPKAVPSAIAARAEAEHAAGKPVQNQPDFRRVDGPFIWTALWPGPKPSAFARLTSRIPDLRKSINAGETQFFDMHLSRLPQDVRYGFLGHVNTAIIEASEVTKYGEIVLTSSVGASPTFCRLADKIIIELNRYHPPFCGACTTFMNPMIRRAAATFLCSPCDRIGQPVIQVDPDRILGVVETNLPDEVAPLSRSGAVDRQDRHRTSPSSWPPKSNAA
jgi:acyl-CoA hydrolase